MSGGVRWAEFVPDMLRLEAAPGSGRVAARASLTMLVSLSSLLALGHLGWGLYATFGAFASVYGGRFPWPGRWRVQVALGLVLTTAVATGALAGTSEQRGWLSVPVAALWAGTAAVLSDRFGWRPPGPLFVVFAVSACAAVPTTPGGVVAAVLVATSAATLAVALGAAETWWSARRGTVTARPPAQPTQPAHRRRIHAVRCVVTVGLAGSLATASGIGHPYWAMVASVVPLTVVTLHAQLLRGAHRLAGTLVGLALAAVLLALQLPEPALIVVVVALQGGAELLIGRNYGAALLCVTSLALLLGQLAVPQPLGTLLLERLLQTLLGVAVGMVAAVLSRDVPAGTSPVSNGSAPPPSR